MAWHFKAGPLWSPTPTEHTIVGIVVAKNIGTPTYKIRRGDVPNSAEVYSAVPSPNGVELRNNQEVQLSFLEGDDQTPYIATMP